MLEKEEIKPIIEALIFAADTALGLDKIANILEGEDREAVKAALTDLVNDYRDGARGFTIEEVAGGYQFRTNPDYAPWLRRLFKIGLQKISKAAMETLAIAAYKQPVTRGEIEAIRGVDSGGVLATLMDKRFIKIVGRKELPGRPVVYGTTKEFLETFDLKDLSCLPSLKDIQTMEEENGLQNTLSEGKTAAWNGPEGEETTREQTDGDEERAEPGAHEADGGEDNRSAEENGDDEDAHKGREAAERDFSEEGVYDEEDSGLEDADARERREAHEGDVSGEENGPEERGNPEEAREEGGPVETGGPEGGEAPEDNSAGGDNVEEKG